MNYRTNIRSRVISILLVIVCMLGLFPATALAASTTPDTIKLTSCTYNGTRYESAALGTCYMHQMKYDFAGQTVMGFCTEKGKGMGWSLEGHKWDSPNVINDPTVKTMMAYFYCHTSGVFTDQAKALGADQIWALTILG